jgi:hypothetical protein
MFCNVDAEGGADEVASKDAGIKILRGLDRSVVESLT